MSFFSNRRLVIATKHSKEQVIAPLLETALGVSCFVAEDFDTDILGTFTGEIARELDPVATARRKCLMAMELADCDLGVASEGSFGPHPSMFFVSADDELLVFIDKKNNFEIIVRELSVETNFNGREVKTEEELLEFAYSVQFPSHGLILRKAKDENSDIIKGITDIKQLKDAFYGLMSDFNTVYAETDMRALYNPSRMKVIEAATHKLISKINSICPQCSKPGFGVTDAKRGLACRLCGLPTNSIVSHIYVCQYCQYTTEELYPHKKTVEDPMYCNYCNP
ncbi:DUF6671 family protein [Hymenobacter antarcticus]|uniref:DUF6671 family protein n=1 Tax=Hymenobacter antarcticus TaxID=486270 RepID=UPI0031EDC2D5